MQSSEVADALAWMSAAWPSWSPSRETAAVWADQLADLPDGLGLDAAKRAVSMDEWPPSVARFREHVAALRPHPCDRAAYAAELPAPAASPEEASEFIEQAKRKIMDATNGGNL